VAFQAKVMPIIAFTPLPNGYTLEYPSNLAPDYTTSFSFQHFLTFSADGTHTAHLSNPYEEG
jgi:hypothetical protein